MIHPHTKVQRINEVIGLGVLATRPIPCGTVTWVKDPFDQSISPAEIAKLPALLDQTAETYCYLDHQGNYILCWDHAKYINHSFDSNCLLTPYGLEIAVRDIAAGEELTNDYGCFNIIAPFEPCEENSERKIVCGDDLQHFHQEWDAQILAAVQKHRKVAQPMHELLDPSIWLELSSVAEGQTQLRSTATMIHLPGMPSHRSSSAQAHQH